MELLAGELVPTRKHTKIMNDTYFVDRPLVLSWHHLKEEPISVYRYVQKGDGHWQILPTSWEFV